MKRAPFIVLLLCALSISSFASRLIILEPQEFAARLTVHDGAELQSLAAEYEDILATRLLPLRPEDATNIFGPKLETHKILNPHKHTRSVVLPLFAPDTVSLSGLLVTNDQSHADFYAVGDVGYVEFFYHWDGKTLANAVFYFRPDDRFVALNTADDFAKRMEWEKPKFAAFKTWMDEHMPKLTDLGEVEVSESSPSRVGLGTGTACIITTEVIHHPNVTNLWYTIALSKDTSDSKEKEKSRQNKSISRPDQSVGFSMDGSFYRLTPRLVKQLHEQNR